MLVVDDSELGEDEREFLQRWAEALQVPVPVLVVRILSGVRGGGGLILRFGFYFSAGRLKKNR